MITDNSWEKSQRLPGLRRFALAITILNLLGHTVLGFEQSWAQPLVSLATAYGLEILLEVIDCRLNHRQPQFYGGWQKLVDFLLSAHITGLAVAMLLYANERLLPIAFASALAIGSKVIFRVAVGNSTRHFLNPSNLGISVTLLLFPWVAIAPPYQFTENLSGVTDWILPVIVVCSGSFLNARFTGRIPMIVAWVGGFIIQALLRSWIFDTPIIPALVPMTGVSFVLFTFYMVTDPGTTPSKPIDQVIFGASVAGVYGLLMVNHIVFGFFFALTIVCILRGLILWSQNIAQHLTAPKDILPNTVGLT